VCPEGSEQTAVMAGPAPVVAGVAVAAVVKTKVVVFVSVLAESNPSSASHARS
jgi:hypothetical protein